ncbi:hypothetical protein BaOVIS_000520 [Babesia ovis]|uniref:Uncharacterized protein n=1 Tax=Babesia ovis TaxID=5869 RepID=A0A9W5WTB7_BABOV|nr:hypothetical protein BaOVIS_000520 [Babesia ovis]
MFPFGSAQREIEKSFPHVFVDINGGIVEGVVLAQQILDIMLDVTKLVDQVVANDLYSIHQFCIRWEFQPREYILETLLLYVVVLGQARRHPIHIIDSFCDDFYIELFGICKAALDESFP